MSPRKHAPHQPLDLRIELNPVSRVPPATRNALRRTHPRGPAIRALEQADVGVTDEHMVHVERIEVHPVARRHIQPPRRPSILPHPHRVHLLPHLPAVQRPVASKQIRRVADIGVRGGHAQAIWRIEPDRLVRRAPLNPGNLQIGRRPVRLLEHNPPGIPPVGRLDDPRVSDPPVRPLASHAEPHIRRPGVLTGAGHASETIVPALRGLQNPLADIRPRHTTIHGHIHARRHIPIATPSPHQSIDREFA